VDAAACRLGAQFEVLALLALPMDMILPTLPLRVLFFSFNTLVEARACAAALVLLCVAVGVADAAAAQPLDDVVAPRIPTRLGSDG